MTKFIIKTDEVANTIQLKIEDVSLKTYIYSTGDVVGQLVERFLFDPPYKVKFEVIDTLTDEFCDRLSKEGYEIDEQGNVDKPYKTDYNVLEKEAENMLSDNVIEIKDEYNQQQLVTLLVNEGYEVSVKLVNGKYIIKVNK